MGYLDVRAREHLPLRDWAQSSPGISEPEVAEGPHPGLAGVSGKGWVGSDWSKRYTSAA